MNDFDNFLENCIVPLIVLPKVSSHFAVVEYARGSVSHHTDGRQHCHSSSTAADWHYVEGVMCSIKGKLHGVRW